MAVVNRVLVVGASRGIGLGLVDVHLDDGWVVHATTRDGSRPRDDADLVAHRYEVRDLDQLDDLVASIEEPLDRVIHNAGVIRGPDMTEINVVAPIRTVEGLLEADKIVAGGQVAIMTSQTGARRGRTGSLGAYGDSKAALNDEFRSRSPDWRESDVVAVVIHPGWVRTDMGGAGAPLSVSESVTGIKHFMDAMTPDDHGRFVTWDGRDHPW
jgi:NAD(P)-dependent dehydrogenase (short-subunit alcohol dehydrogenase family)